MTRHLAPGLLGLLLLAGGCKARKTDERPIAGLHSAGASLLRVEKKEKRPVPVGAQLRPGDRVEATGPALIEYFGGGLRFLSKGDELEVGEAPEANLLGPNLPSRRWAHGEVHEAPPAQRIIAARYVNNAVTPASAQEKPDHTTGELFRAFFSPNGIEELGKGPRPDGPAQGLPPPPLRPKVPFIHAGPLGEGGLVVEVEDGFVVAEADDLATAVIVEGGPVPLGRTVRLLVPPGAEVELRPPGGAAVELEGPADLRLR